MTESGIATFVLDLTGLKFNTVVLLGAVIRVGSNISLAPPPWRGLAAASSGVAVSRGLVQLRSEESARTRDSPSTLAPSPRTPRMARTPPQRVGDGIMRVSLFGILVGVGAVSLGGCSMIPTIQENTGRIGASTSAITENTEAIRMSIASLDAARPSIDRIADMRPRLDSLARNLEDVSALGPSLDAAATLDEPLLEMSERVADLRRSMAAIDGLRRSIDDVLGIQPSLDNLVALREPLEELAELRDPLARSGDLAEPMRDLTRGVNDLLALADRITPLLVFGLVGWGLVTFLAVWLGIALGFRRRITPVGS